MARNYKQQKGAVAEAVQSNEVAPMRGGTLGVPAPRLQAVPTGMAGDRRGRQDQPTGRQFKVVGGPMQGNEIMVNYPGQGKVRLLRGKVISDSSCDLDHLRKQGVELVEVTPPAPPPPAPHPEEDEGGEDEEEDEAGED